MSLKTKGAATVAALSLFAAPAVAQDTTQKTPPAQLCAKESKKKTNGGKGKSPFAACVSGARKAQAEIRRNEQNPPKAKDKTTAPGQICRTESRKRTAADKEAGRKSPFAACVTGATKAQQEAPQS